MNEFIIIISKAWPFGLTIIVIVLVGCILQLTNSYRRLLEKYSQLERKKDYGHIKTQMRESADEALAKEVKESIARATGEAVELIEKNAQSVAKDVREKAIERMAEEEKGEEKAVAGEYDRTHEELAKYKEQKFEEIRKNANIILKEITLKVLKKEFTASVQDELVTKALEDAKQSGLF